jgi:hypothetical protein
MELQTGGIVSGVRDLPCIGLPRRQQLDHSGIPRYRPPIYQAGCLLDHPPDLAAIDQMSPNFGQ